MVLSPCFTVQVVNLHEGNEKEDEHFSDVMCDKM